MCMRHETRYRRARASISSCRTGSVSLSFVRVYVCTISNSLLPSPSIHNPLRSVSRRLLYPASYACRAHEPEPLCDTHASPRGTCDPRPGHPDQDRSPNIRLRVLPFFFFFHSPYLALKSTPMRELAVEHNFLRVLSIDFSFC